MNNDQNKVMDQRETREDESQDWATLFAGPPPERAEISWPRRTCRIDDTSPYMESDSHPSAGRRSNLHAQRRRSRHQSRRFDRHTSSRSFCHRRRDRETD